MPWYDEDNWLCYHCRDAGIAVSPDIPDGWHASYRGVRIVCPYGHGSMWGPYRARDPRLPLIARARAQQNWKRARTQIAKLTRGSFPGSIMMTERYLLEGLDPRHRYGPALGTLFNMWLVHSEERGTFDDFLQWLEQHPEQPTRGVIQLSAEEREKHKVTLVGNRIVLPAGFPPNWRQPIEEGRVSDLIFVTDRANDLYVGIKVKERFQHSSFFSGAPVRMAGTFGIQGLNIVGITNGSGHYGPSRTALAAFLRTMTTLDMRRIQLDVWEVNRWTYKGPAAPWLRAQT